MTHSDWIKAYKKYHNLRDDLDEALALCDGMDDDFRRISEWAEIFEQPGKLSETVAKNWLLHKRAIKKDIDREKKDWDSGNYFNAGADTADALVKLIGPVPDDLALF